MRPILKAHIEKREFHHAYLLCGDGEAGKKMAERRLESYLRKIIWNLIRIFYSDDSDCSA